MTTTTLSKIARTLRGASRIAIVTHISPDPDAIGSALGLMHALVALGKEVVPLCDDDIPAELLFLPGVELIHRTLPDGFKPDVAVALDASDPERLGTFASFVTDDVPLVVIDHHVTNLKYGSLNLVEPAAAATAELLVEVVDRLGAPLSGEVATCLATGLVGDTRSFSIPGVTPNTLRVGARLVEAGAPLASITERVMNTRTFASLQMWELALEGMKLEGGVIWATLPLDERKVRDLLHVEGQGLPNLLLSVDEAYISALFTERTDGLIDISFRAKPGFDVATLALELGGGGHPLAAGCLVEGPLEDVVARVVARLKAQVDERTVKEV